MSQAIFQLIYLKRHYKANKVTQSKEPPTSYGKTVLCKKIWKSHGKNYEKVSVPSKAWITYGKVVESLNHAFNIDFI